MSYMICNKCGKHYPLEEGKTSFNFERCDCGGQLEYSHDSKQKPMKKYQKTPTNLFPKIKWKGILVGLLFLFVCLILSVAGFFGTNIPSDPTQISSQFLIYFTIITVIFTIVSGAISAYISGSNTYVVGAINGGMVGVILGLILGLVGGLMVFISGIIIFGSLSLLGGIIGILPRKLSKKTD
jgi:Na+/melibiose symporter-like transporter